MRFGVGEFPDVLFEITDKTGPNFGSAGYMAIIEQRSWRDQSVGKVTELRPRPNPRRVIYIK